MSLFLPMIVAFLSVDPAPVDHLVVSKAKHTLTLYARGKPVHVYDVSLGRASSPKQIEGDEKTPEGHYVIDGHNPNSSFFMALHVSYPNQADRLRASKLHRRAGGDIMIHGLPPNAALLGPVQHLTDWTIGCIALSNEEMKVVYDMVPNGTPIDIEP